MVRETHLNSFFATRHRCIDVHVMVTIPSLRTLFWSPSCVDLLKTRWWVLTVVCFWFLTAAYRMAFYRHVKRCETHRFHHVPDKWERDLVGHWKMQAASSISQVSGTAIPAAHPHASNCLDPISFMSEQFQPTSASPVD